MSLLQKIQKRGLCLAFAGLVLSTVMLAAFPAPKASAYTLVSGFRNAAQWIMLTGTVFDKSDYDNELLDKGLVERLGRGNVDNGIKVINEYLARLTQNGTARWKDSDSMDGNHEYLLTGCEDSKLRQNGDNNSNWAVESIYIDFPGENCPNILENWIHFTADESDKKALNTQFEYTNSHTIYRVDRMFGPFVQNEPSFPNSFFLDPSADTDDAIYIEVFNDGTMGRYL
jgi:hypothetical protein